MAWWLWTIIGIVGYCICGVATLFVHSLLLPAKDRAKDYDDIDPGYVRSVFFIWPYYLFIEVPFDCLFRFLFKTVHVANGTATKIERKAELRRLQETHEVKEEETYPIPHEVSEAQWRQAQGMRNQYMPNNHLRSLPGETYQEWVQRVHGGKNES